MHWTFHPITRLEELAPAWNALNAAMGGLPFLEVRYLVPLCGEFGEPDMRIATCEDARGPLAMAIVTRAGTMMWETFQPSQLPLGAWVMRPGEELGRLLPGLMAALPGFALSLSVTQQDPACVPRPPDSPRLRTLDYIQTARLPIAGSFDDYWAARGRNLRHNMKRQRAKLKGDGVATSLEILTRPEDVPAAIADYGRLESAGWKAEGGTAIHPDNAQGRFYGAMLAAFCATGVGRVFRYRFDDRVVAIDMCIEGGGALVILKTTYDESVKTISPAFLMREEAFRLLFEERRVGRVEFYGRVMDWHLRWTDDVRTLYHVNCYRSPLVPRLKMLAGRFLSRPAG